MTRAILPLLLVFTFSFSLIAQEEDQDFFGRHTYMAKKFKKIDKIAFSKFIVTFSTAASQTGPLDAEHSRYGTFLNGISAEMLQQITDSLYADFTTQLAGLGYEVLDDKLVVGSKTFEKWNLELGTKTPWLADLPYDIQQFGDREVAICFASETPDYRHADLTRLPGKNGKFQDLSNELGAIVISVGFHVYFMDYDKNSLGKTSMKAGQPKLYLASNMQTKLNTQITFHLWDEKMKEPVMATYWLADPLYSESEIGSVASSVEAVKGGDLSPNNSDALANNVLTANKKTYKMSAETLLEKFANMALEDWQNSIHDR